MSLAVEVQRVQIRLHLAAGEDADAVLFVHTVAPHDSRPETVASRLNEPGERFVPFEIEGRVVLVRMASIVAVELPGAPPEIADLEQVGGLRAGVEMVLSTGRRLQGELHYEAPEGRRRVLDLMNSTRDRFVLMSAEERYFLIRKGAIDQVRDI